MKLVTRSMSGEKYKGEISALSNPLCNEFVLGDQNKSNASKRGKKAPVDMPDILSEKHVHRYAGTRNEVR
jgi:hypothetical protein